MLDVEALSEMMTEIIAEEVQKAVEPLKARIAELEARPTPEKGEPGERGEPGEKGQDGKDGRDGTDGNDGKDAAGIVDVLKDSGELVLTLQDGRLVRTGIRDGEKGSDGQDGFSLEDFICEATDERTLKMMFVRGEVEHSYELQFPLMVYKGIFREGESYERGDMVTWGGSMWHCDEPTTEKPDTKKASESAWTLAAKKGRDGKDAK